MDRRFARRKSTLRGSFCAKTISPLPAIISTGSRRSKTGSKPGLAASAVLPAKRNYGGQAAGHWMQLQSAYDHVILSTCYEGEFDLKPGRVKISHRFNQQGRIDFVELKFLRSLQPCLNGEIRSLLRVRDYPTIRKDWRAAEAFILPVLPQELIFLYQDIFRSPRHEVLAWLVNIGHRIVGDLLEDLRTRPVNGSVPQRGTNGDQLCLQAVRTDEVAAPILEHAAALESTVELSDPKTAWVRYTSRCCTGLQLAPFAALPGLDLQRGSLLPPTPVTLESGRLPEGIRLGKVVKALERQPHWTSRL